MSRRCSAGSVFIAAITSRTVFFLSGIIVAQTRVTDCVMFAVEYFVGLTATARQTITQEEAAP